MSNESGRYEIYVRPFSGASSATSAGGQWQVSTSGGISPRWRPDGKELYYIAPDGKLMAAPITANGRDDSSRARPWPCFRRGFSAAVQT